MSKRLSALIAALCGCLLLAFAATDARADRRIALVVGNANYANPSLVLSNPKNDAEDVAAALRSLGFEVVQAIDANKRDMDTSMAKFARLATDSDAALFYYAGHALQYQGRNYLMPIDAEVEDEVSLRYQMIAIDDVRAALDRASGVKVMVLDACRNNPVVDSLRRKMSGESRAIGGGVRGLARIDKTQGTVIAYSTAADEVAADGQGRNSPFTTAFLKRLKEPGLEIEQLFRRVAADVNTSTGGRQRPETYVSLLSDYYLNQTDRVAFDAIKDSADPAALRDFIDRFPASSFASDARYRIQHIEIEAQERQLQQARQQEAARLLAQQNTDQDAARTKIARTDAPNAGKNLPPPARPPEGSTKLAGVERQDLTSSNLLTPLPQSAPLVTLAPKAAVEPTQPPPASSNKSCDQDNARLARLRSGGSLDEVVQFERELGCDRLRPQVARLRESLGGPAPAAPVLEAPKPVAPVIATLPKPAAALPATIPNAATPSPIQTPVPSRPSASAADQTPACKQDEARLARLRASPSLADVTAFERELGCEKLRPQLVRLRESLAPPDSAAGPGTRSVYRADLSSETPALSTDEIAKSVKSELSRVGCFSGSIDSDWNAQSRRSLDLFNKNAGTKLDLANLDTLDAIKLKTGRVCPPVCEHGFKADGDHCTRIACAEGSSLNDDNECETVRPRKSTAKRNTDDDRPARTVRERPRTEASTAKPQGSQGQVFCDQAGCHPVARGCRVGPIGAGGSGTQVCN